MEGAFDTFWTAYPRKVGKPTAFQAFCKALKRGTLAEIMAGLALHLPCEQWKDPTKVPHPTTWLNRDGWNDQVVSQPGLNGSNWWESRTGLMDKAIELVLPAPPDACNPHQWMAFKAAVWNAAGDGPWWDHTDTAYPLAVKLRNEGNPA